VGGGNNGGLLRLSPAGVADSSDEFSGGGQGRKGGSGLGWFGRNGQRRELAFAVGGGKEGRIGSLGERALKEPGDRLIVGVVEGMVDQRAGPGTLDEYLDINALE